MIKRVIYLMALLIVFVGCRSAKNTTTAMSTDSLSIVYHLDSIGHIIHQEIDTTSSRHVVTTITEIVLDDSIGASINEVRNKASPGDNLAQAIIGSAAGKIKKIKETRIEEYSENLGKSVNNESNTDISIKSTSTKSTSETDTKVQVAPDPYRWRYIFIGLAVIALSIVVIKIWPKSIQPSMVWGWVKRIVSCIQGLFN